MIRNVYESNFMPHPQKQKEKKHTQIAKRSQKVNGINSSFLNWWSFSRNINFNYFLLKKRKQEAEWAADSILLETHGQPVA